MITNFRIIPGMHDFLFDALRNKISIFEVSSDKYCILCTDEASLKTSLFYNIKDEVIEFEDVGNNKSFSPACNVAVLMTRSLCRSWKQSLGYYFLHSTFPSDRIKNVITETIIKLQGIGLKVIALITDMSSNFIQMAKLFKVTTNSPYFIINNEQIAFFLIPHMYKKLVEIMFTITLYMQMAKNILDSYRTIICNRQ